MTSDRTQTNAPSESRSTRWLDRALLCATLLTCAIALAPNVPDPDLWGHVQYGRDWLAQGFHTTATYSYTDNGELLTKTVAGATSNFTYDVLGNLKKVVLPSGTTIEYVIDASNRRVGRKVDGILEKAWLYKDGLNPIAAPARRGDLLNVGS